MQEGSSHILEANKREAFPFNLICGSAVIALFMHIFSVDKHFIAACQ